MRVLVNLFSGETLLTHTLLITYNSKNINLGKRKIYHNSTIAKNCISRKYFAGRNYREL